MRKVRAVRKAGQKAPHPKKAAHAAKKPARAAHHKLSHAQRVKKH